jgi:putative DNA primase/helicase
MITATHKATFQEVKLHAKGRELDILAHFGFPRDLLDGKHHGCPICKQGKDCFRLIDHQAGAVLCNKCFKTENGDFFDAVGKLTGMRKTETLQAIASYLSVSCNNPAADSTPTSSPRKTYPDERQAELAANIRALAIEARHEYRDSNEKLLAVVLRLIETSGQKTFRPTMKLPDGNWIVGTLEGLRPLYGMNTLAGAEVVIVCEGELTADALHSLGFASVTWMSGAPSVKLANWAALANLGGLKTIAFLPDNDSAGRDAMRIAIGILRKLNPCLSLKLVEVPGIIELGEKADAADLVRSYPDDLETPRQEILAAIETAELCQFDQPAPLPDDVGSLGTLGTLQKNQPNTKAKPRARIVPMARIEPVELAFLWPSKLPLGKVSQFAGDGGVGKSFLSMDIATRVSLGSWWPDGSGQAPFGSVLILNSEDAADDTIRPRLDAMGADVSKIYFLEAIQIGDEYERAFSLKDDIERLSEVAEELGDLKLIIIDPISSYLAGTDSHNSGDIRAALDPLKVLAERTGAAVLLINHLNKGSGAAIHRTCGSVAITAMTRTSWAIAKDRDDPLRRLVLPIKSNIGPDEHGMAYRIVDGRLEWEISPVSISADEALEHNPKRNGKPRAIELAEKWLREYLAHGDQESEELLQAAEKAGHSRRTIFRVKEKIGFNAYKDGVKNGRWFWPKLEPIAEECQMSNSANTNNDWHSSNI